MSAPANRPGAEELNRSREAAARARGEWLLLVNQDLCTVNDLVRTAAAPEGRPLLRLSLRQVLMAQPAWGRKRAGEVLGKVLSVAGGIVGHVQPTVGWLIDPRSGGRRYAAFLDALEPKDGPPWKGFPYSPRSAR